ncbi:MAG: thiamine pyrophosphate-dependent dehydrogenase E1 component subunit alpha [Oligoflexia bacterium]|nr:thiamine pyrophosphate-dependent dehydrogenase E1 component subunit alpha [Oligoflexia bacterium]
MATQNASQLDHQVIEKVYSLALRIRMLEDALAREYPKAEMKTPIHLCTGQEAIAAGVCANLTKDDIAYAYYRSHGWYLAKGGNLDEMVSEFFGKATGCSRGFGGSMHLIDLKVGFQGTTAIVGAAIPHAVGAAFTIKYKKQNHVAIAAFGDGASEEGLFQESLMFAAVRKLPVIFICENNGLATNTWINERQPDVPIYKRGAGFGVNSVQVDGNNALEVYKAMNAAVARARAGEGPSFIECKTYRILEHCGPNYDVSVGYRTQKEVDDWKLKDPIAFLETIVSSDAKERLRKKHQDEIDAAFVFARQAPFPTSMIPEGYSCP